MEGEKSSIGSIEVQSQTAMSVVAHAKKEYADEGSTKVKSDAFNVARKIVADYSSGSEDESSEDIDSDPDSPESESDEISEILCESSSEEDLEELIQPVEDLKISVPKEEAKEIGFVKHIVECQVVVEPTAGGPPLDLGTVLFLDEGQRALGRVDDVFGPVTEPLYLVMFHSDSEIKIKDVKPGVKVYYAPRTDHTLFAPVAELMRMKGSDASWKHNREAPSDCQEFSDDEEEARARGEIPPDDGVDSRRPQKRNWQRRAERNRSPRSPRAPRNREEQHRNTNGQFRMPMYPPPAHFGPPQFNPPNSGPDFNPPFRNSLLPTFNPIMPPPSPPGYLHAPNMMPPPLMHCNMPPLLRMPMLGRGIPPQGIPPPPLSHMRPPALFCLRPPPPPPPPPPLLSNNSSLVHQRQPEEF